MRDGAPPQLNLPTRIISQIYMARKTACVMRTSHERVRKTYHLQRMKQ